LPGINIPLQGKTAFSSLLLLTAIFFLNFFARVIFSPLLPSIEKTLVLSHGQAGTIFLVISCGYFISLLGSGFVSSRLGHKNTIVLSMFFISASLFLIASLTSLAHLQSAFFLLGLGAGVYLPSAIATIAELFPHVRWARAFAVHELAPNMAFITAPLFSAFLLTRLHWQQITLILAFAAFLAGSVYHYLGRGKNIFGTTPTVPLCLTILKQRDFLILVVIFSLGISSTIGIFNILPLFLVTNHTMALQDANLLAGLSRVMTLGTALLGGYLADRFGNRKTIAGVLLLTGLATMGIGMTDSIFLIVSIFLQPLLAVCFFPAGFALLSRLSIPAARNVVISLAIPLSFLIGGGLLPALITAMADMGQFHTGIVLTGLFICAGTFLVGLISNTSPLAEKTAPAKQTG
jgi:NNP family nitrate/nitrite transporter-like MFS transporter